MNPPPLTSPIADNGVVGGRIFLETPGAATDTVLVAAAGTEMTATVSGLGEFVLPNVPAGPLELRFTSPATAASLPLGEIAGGETIALTVRLAGNTATLISISRVRGSDAMVEGVIEPPGAADGTLIVGGRTVTLPPGTPVQRGGAAGTAADLAAGVRVRITGVSSAAGITAREIVIL